MNEQNRITSFLKENPSFTTKDFVGMVKESQAAYSDRKAYRMLKDLQDDGRIMKVGRGHYSKTSVKSPYHFKASSLMDELVGLIDKEYPLITYQTWELYQWNEFVNHQLAPPTLTLLKLKVGWRQQSLICCWKSIPGCCLILVWRSMTGIARTI